MGKNIKYPIGVQDFEKLISEGYLYVDKTSLIHRLVTTGNCFFLSRPRRFGKSLTLSTIKAFFEGKKHLFKGLKVYDLEKDWNRHPVFLLSFARFDKDKEGSIEGLLENHLSTWEKEYDLPVGVSDYENRFANLLRQAVKITGQRAVILIDEYDSALVTTLENKDRHDHIKSILKPFYTVLKDLDSHIRFAMITGITRFSKLTIFSGLNILNDISLDDEFSGLCGITFPQLKEYFQQGIESLRNSTGLTYEECLQELKDYYDGYRFSVNSPDIYNPFSILNALFKSKLDNYWFASGIPSFIVGRMKHRDIDLEKYLTQNATGSVLMEADNVYISDVAVLFQAGFLTIKAYNPERKLYTLGIPNREVEEGMSRLFLEKFLWQDTLNANAEIFRMVDAIEAGDPDKFLQILKAFFAGVPFELSKGDKEVYFHNAFYIVTNLIGLNVKAEQHTSEGSIDIVLSTPKFVFVIEIKLNKNAAKALEQINTKNYTLPWSAANRKVFKIGVSFSSRTRNIGSWIIE